MRTIWKFTLQVGKPPVIMPQGATLLHVGMQFGTLCLWALVDSDAPLVTRRLVVKGTGWDCHDVEASHHVGSVVDEVGGFVWHIFDCGSEFLP